jgi:hypothetical protein
MASEETPQLLISWAVTESLSQCQERHQSDFLMPILPHSESQARLRESVREKQLQPAFLILCEFTVSVAPR